MTEIDLERTANVPISEGIHTLRILSGEENVGEKGVYWMFTIGCDDPGEENKTCRLVISLSPQARWRAEIFLNAIAAPGKGKASIEKFIGRVFKGQIMHELYEGRTQANIKEMFPIKKETGVSSAAVPVVVSSKVVEDNLPDDSVDDIPDFS